jgi:hypothetical protein
VCFLLCGLALINGRVASAQPGESTIANGLPDLQGLWQVYDPRNFGKVVASFNIAQSGNRLTLRVLPEGKPAAVVFEGTFESNTAIAGRALDTKSPPDNPRWGPLTVVVKDANHLLLDAGLVLTRTNRQQAASFNQTRRFSQSALPARPFNLNGQWSFEDGYRVTLRVTNGEITMTSADAHRFMFLRGTYASNPDIAVKAWERHSNPDNPTWIDRKIVVESPDVIRVDKELVYRVSKPQSHDIPCDAQNTNHVTGQYAYVRGATALSEKDYRTARCWLTIAADWEIPAAQSTLAALIIRGDDGVPPDYARAFELAGRSAQYGDVDGQYQLAAMYQAGKGTPQDAQKARAWRRKAEETAQIQAAMSPEGVAKSLGMVLGMAGSMLDFDLNMTPTSCYSQQVLGNRPTSACHQ